MFTVLPPQLQNAYFPFGPVHQSTLDAVIAKATQIKYVFLCSKPLAFAKQERRRERFIFQDTQ